MSDAPEEAQALSRPLRRGLGARTARSGALTVTSQAFQLFLSTAGTLVLARLLTPNDYGTVAMISTVLGFAAVFRDLGLSEATVQRKEISQGEISTLFWLNVIIGAALTGVVALLAPALAWFFETPSLKSLTIAYSATFLIGAAAVQHAALLRRRMAFGSLAVIEAASLGTGLAVTVLLAWYGTGYWALALGRLAEALAYTIGATSASRWRPSHPRGYAEVRPLLAFGANLTGFSLMNYLARNLDALLIGKAWGAEQLGLYSKAYGLLLLPLRQINAPLSAVAVPALSRLIDDADRYRAAYCRILGIISIIAMPLAAFFIVNSDWVILVAFGPRWAEASPLFSLLGISALVQPITNTTGWLFVSQNRTRELLHWGVISSAVVTASFLLGLPFGAAGVAASYSLVSVVVATPMLLWFVGRRGPVGVGDIWHAALPGLGAGTVVFAALLLLRRAAVVTAPVFGLIVSVALTGLCVVALLGSTSGGRQRLRDMRQAAAQALPWTSATGQ
jgi:PST family polysaccharide transporter